MEKFFSKSMLGKYGFLALGVFFLSLGGMFFSCSGIGMDPLSVFYSGVANVLHVRLGTGTLIVGVVLLAILLFWDRKRIGIGTVAVVAFIGPLINVLLDVFGYTAQGWAIKLISCGAGILSYGIGMACYLHSDLGCGPVDALMLHFEEKAPISLTLFKVGFDVLCVVLGALLGGVFGVGTVLAAFLSGPAMSAILRLLGDDPDADKKQKAEVK